MSQLAKTLSQQALSHWLALWRAPGIGPGKFAKLLEIFPDPGVLFTVKAGTLTKLGLPEKTLAYLQRPDWEAVAADLAWQEQQPHHHIITWQDSAYPDLLREIAAAPPILFVSGQPEALKQPQLAMVGSRNPTATGYEIAYHFAKHLAVSGLTITSGLALGVDTASHHGALTANHSTIAVLGTGLERLYPARNRQLAEKIISRGAIVSEFPLQTGPHAANFPRRNRLISGLSLGVLVVEATLKSGSLITANYALEQSREVFAIPSSIHNPLAKGCHALIRQGAKLVEAAEHITEELSLFKSLAPNSKFVQNINKKSETLDKIQQKLVKCVGYEATPLESLITRSGLSAEVVAAKLLALELNGYVKLISGGYIRAEERHERNLT